MAVAHPHVRQPSPPAARNGTPQHSMSHGALHRRRVLYFSPSLTLAYEPELYWDFGDSPAACRVRERFGSVQYENSILPASWWI
jgi:hypothetical protein